MLAFALNTLPNDFIERLINVTFDVEDFQWSIVAESKMSIGNIKKPPDPPSFLLNFFNCKDVGLAADGQVPGRTGLIECSGLTSSNSQFRLSSFARPQAWFHQVK
jgi:hypothetical protein